LPFITDKRVSPFVDIEQGGLLGTDYLYFYPGLSFNATPAVYKLVSYTVRLNTDAVVANRQVSVRIPAIIAGDEAIDAVDGANVAASSAVTFRLIGADPVANTSIGDQGALLCGDSFTIQAPYYLRGQIITGKAGDTWYVKARFKFMNWELGMIDESNKWWRPY